jgi:putative ABC transport system permease protein
MPLVIGVAIVSLVTVFATSLKASFGGELRSDVVADLTVNTAAFGGGRLSPKIVDELSALPGARDVVALGQGPVLLDGRSAEVTAADVRALPLVVRVHSITGELSGNGMAVSRSTAQSRGWTLGRPVVITFSGGSTQTLAVQGIYEDNAVLGGVVIPASIWAVHTVQPTERSVFVNGAARSQVEPIALRYGGEVQDTSEYAAAATKGLDMLLSIVYVLMALAVVIALLGIGNALSLAVYERRREIGLLRAVGQSRRQARSVIRLEALIIACFGTLVGMAIGTVAGWALFEALSSRPGFTVPSSRLVVIALFGALAGLLAARRPAKRASRTPILEAIATL